MAAPPPPPVTLPPARPVLMAEPPPDDAQPTAPSPSVSGVSGGSLAWLESLAADQNDDLFNLDLSDDEPAAAPAANPVSWLEDLARTQGELTPAAPPPAVPAVADDDLDLNWLERLALRQGADPEELITGGVGTPPPIDEAAAEPPAYTPFSFETPPPRPASSPASWLEDLAAAQGYDEAGVGTTRPTPEPEPVDLSPDGIQRAIADGSVTSEQMQVWLNIQADRAMEQPELPIIDSADDLLALDADPGDEAAALPGEIPAWLLEQIGAPPAVDAPPAAPARPSLESLFPVADEEPAAPAVPAWLLEDLDSSEPVTPADIFTDEPIAAAPVEVDAADPWVEAFDQEYEQGAVNIENVPDWYSRNISDPQRIRRVTEQVEGVSAEAEPQPAADGPLMAARLPGEPLLSPGEAQPMPDWMAAALPIDVPAAVVPEVVITAEPLAVETAEAVPDWLADIEQAISPADIPDWLKESIGVPAPAPEPEPVPVPVAVVQPEPPRPTPAPAPAPAPVRPQPTGISLEQARQLRQGGDLPASLSAYETLIRASASLDEVVDDLSTLVKLERGNPAIYRVLGDGLMRQGKLQAALDTYREALNQL